jgi:hypothetical protein
MNLVVLYGRPAVGKLTVARILAERIGAPLFHNHLTVNLVLSVFPFGSPAFIEMRERIWMAVFRRAIAEGVPTLIFTFNPENTVSQAFIDGLFGEVAAAGGRVIPVELVAGESAIEARLGSQSRARAGKTLDLGTYRMLREKGAFDSPVLRSTHPPVDTGVLSPEEAADSVAALLGY